MLESSIVYAERITEVVTHHGEGPFWDARGRRLLCVDLLAGVVVAIRSDGDISRHQIPSPVAAVIRRRRSGGFVIATERGVVISDETLSEFTEHADFGIDAEFRVNDGGCDPAGRFFVGTMAYDARPGGGELYRLETDGRIAGILSGVSISNGLQWSNDGTHAYYVDSPTRRIDVFDVSPLTGEWSHRRPFVQIDADAGVPDGMAIDERDGLWVALWGGGAVNHYDASGHLVETIRVPGVTQVSSCAFGGDDRSILYITTSRQGLAGDSEPNAGALFAFSPGVRGAIPFEFGG